MKGSIQVPLKMDWVDRVKLIALIAVIGIHVSAYAITSENIGNSKWLIANFYESLFRFCVPAFVMVTGALLLPQDIPAATFFKKRIHRILMPFIFWSMVYLGISLALKIKTEGHQAFNHIFEWLYKQIVYGTAVHLWYVYMLIGLYLIIPVLQPWLKIATNKAVLYFLGIWIITVILTQFQISEGSPPLDLRYFSGYIGYLVLGYYISNRLMVTKRLKVLSLIFFLLGIVVTFIGTFYFSISRQNFSPNFYEFLTINVCLSGAGLCILTKSMQLSYQGSFINILQVLSSRYGFGIYLCHPLILMIMAHFGLNYKLCTSAISIPICMVICLSISSLLIFTINKMPYGKYISG